VESPAVQGRKGKRHMPADGAEPVVIPTDLWQRPDMHTALTNRDIGHLFRLVRQYAGISQTRIGVAVGFSQGKVSEYMKNKAQVTALDVFERIAEGLGMPDPARMTLGLAPRVLTGVTLPATPIPARDGTPASSLLSVEQVVIGSRQSDDACDVDMLTLAWIVGRLDGHMDRRTMLLIAAGLTAESAASIANPWERLALALSGNRADQEDTVERLEARTVGFHRLEETMPARSLYQSLTAHLNELSTLLQAGLPDRLRRRLAATTGEAAVLASWIAWEIKQPGQSAAFDRIALPPEPCAFPEAPAAPDVPEAGGRAPTAGEDPVLGGVAGPAPVLGPVAGAAPLLGDGPPLPSPRGASPLEGPSLADGGRSGPEVFPGTVEGLAADGFAGAPVGNGPLGLAVDSAEDAGRSCRTAVSEGDPPTPAEGRLADPPSERSGIPSAFTRGCGAVSDPDTSSSGTPAAPEPDRATRPDASAPGLPPDDVPPGGRPLEG
jgi:Helix-turn-helix domain